VEKVLAQPLSHPAQAAVGTVVDGLVRIVVPELADPAVVVGRRLRALGAGIRRLLRTPAEHTEHVLGLLARQDMVLDCVVAVPARVPPLARGALQLDVSAVVLAAEVSFLFFFLLLDCPPFHPVRAPLVWRKGRPEVLLGQRQIEPAGSVAERVPFLQDLQGAGVFGGLADVQCTRACW
jgi:hypothetical protein